MHFDIHRDVHLEMAPVETQLRNHARFESAAWSKSIAGYFLHAFFACFPREKRYRYGLDFRRIGDCYGDWAPQAYWENLE